VFSADAMDPEVKEAPASSWLYSFRFLLLVTVASGVISEAVAMGLRVSGLRNSMPALLAISLPALVAGALLPYLLIRFVYRSTLRDFGVRWIDPQRPALRWFLGSAAGALILWFAFWGLLCVLLQFAAQAAPDQTAVSLAEFHERNPLGKLLRGDFDARLLGYVIHMTIVVGFAEELFGRGLLQNALDRSRQRVLGKGRFTVRVSTLLAALLFAFWHTTWLTTNPLEILSSMAISMTIVLVPSLLLAVVYEKTRSLLVVILLHDVIDGGKLLVWYVWSLILPGS
jgi:membrane protease YdiL (CAAX protease family)